MRGATISDVVADLLTRLATPAGDQGGTRPENGSGSGSDRRAAFPMAATAVPASSAGSIPNQAPDEEADWASELTLDADIVRPPDRAESGPTSGPILLIGATGFLGAFLLRDLLRETQEQVFCLVRCRDREQGAWRIREALEGYMIWEEEFNDRIVAIPGDLARPSLGLTPRAAGELAESLGVIYHNGARLNFINPYSVLQPDNVLGTREVLRLACQGRPKIVHFVSSLGVFDLRTGGRLLTFGEHDEPGHPQDLKYGYTRTKVVAERLVREAGRRGLPIAIYRPGMINACTETGASTTQDVPAPLLKSWVDLEDGPEHETSLAVHARGLRQPRHRLPRPAARGRRPDVPPEQRSPHRMGAAPRVRVCGRLRRGRGALRAVVVPAGGHGGPDA